MTVRPQNRSVKGIVISESVLIKKKKEGLGWVSGNVRVSQVGEILEKGQQSQVVNLRLREVLVVVM